MKTKKEIIKEYLEDAEESLAKIEITAKYLQGRYASENKQFLLDELAKLSANKKETEKWMEFLKMELNS